MPLVLWSKRALGPRHKPGQFGVAQLADEVQHGPKALWREPRLKLLGNQRQRSAHDVASAVDRSTVEQQVPSIERRAKDLAIPVGAMDKIGRPCSKPVKSCALSSEGR